MAPPLEAIMIRGRGGEVSNPGQYLLRSDHEDARIGDVLAMEPTGGCRMNWTQAASDVVLLMRDA